MTYLVASGACQGSPTMSEGPKAQQGPARPSKTVKQWLESCFLLLVFQQWLLCNIVSRGAKAD